MFAQLALDAKKVTIAFDDPTVGQYGPIWSTAIPIILAELESAGVSRTDVRLICANALHRLGRAPGAGPTRG